MKITIDTTVDSQEDIRKVLQILHHVVDKKNSLSNYDTTASVGMFAEPAKPVEDTTNMMSMFASPEASPSMAAEPVPDTPPDFSSLLSLQNKEQSNGVTSSSAWPTEENKKEEPKLEFF
jgi:hypothetical protein